VGGRSLIRGGIKRKKINSMIKRRMRRRRKRERGRG